mmetsp:Transcript_69315/g.214334  ORF Transcript_69315/g.214334 Transcript_69315/m.214334 type:complete len:374 (+) Transcript_69315:53-1174(+)
MVAAMRAVAGLLLAAATGVLSKPDYVFIPRSAGAGPVYAPADSRSERCRYPPIVGTSVPGFVFTPSGDHGPKGGVVLLHECMGIQQYVMQVAESLAASGSFVVVVLNVFRESSPFMTPVDFRYTSGEKLGSESEECMWKMRHLDWSSAVEDVAAAVAYLHNNHSVTGVATWGFSMGAALSLLTAAKQVPHLSAAVAYYGFPDHKTAPGAGALFEPASVQVPVLAEFGEFDPFTGFSSPSTAALVEGSLTSAENIVTHVQPGCGHSFMNDAAWARWDGGQRVNETCRNSGWRTALDFLVAKLHTAVPLQEELPHVAEFSTTSLFKIWADNRGAFATAQGGLAAFTSFALVAMIFVASGRRSRVAAGETSKPFLK